MSNFKIVSHNIVAIGIKGENSDPWSRSFDTEYDMNLWCEIVGATVTGYSEHIFHDIIKPTNTYKVGDRFIMSGNAAPVDTPAIKHDTGNHILCQVDERKICLISIDTGNRYVNPITLSDSQSPKKITEEQLFTLCGSCWSKYSPTRYNQNNS